VALRPTTDADDATMHELFLDSIAAVYRPHGFDPPAPPLEVFANQQRHVRRTGVSVAAEDRGRVVGFASVWIRGDDWYLASLFVDTRSQQRGLGAALLDAVWGDAPRRRTITDAIQPVSNALYARRGLVPATPVLTFTGKAQAESHLEPAPEDVAAVDRAAYGFERAADHAHWSRFGNCATWAGAYSYPVPGGAIGPVAGTSPDAAAAALEAELARAPGPVSLRLPGSSRRLVEVALAAGLRLAPTPGLLLLSAGVAPPAALAIGSYTLF
jgi:ribosomal protein S18 acetylase RimI-like enzyme